MTRTRTAVLVALVACAAVIAGAAAPAAAAGGAPTDGSGQDAGVAGATAAAPSIADAQSDQLNCSYPRTFTDAGGADVQIDQEPQEIVTLNPSAAQTLWEIGGREKVVGVSSFASYLDGAENRTSISGESGAASAEKVVDLDPDLVLAPNTIQPETVESLRSDGLTVYHFAESSSIEDVYAKTELIGELTGECEGAAETVSWMQEEIDAVEENVSDGDRPRVYFEFFGTTPAANTFQNDILTTAGGKNVAAEAGLSGWVEMNDETLVEQDPQILLLLEGAEVPDSEAAQASSAVRNDRIVRVDANQVQQPAPHVVYAIRDINEGIERYEDELAAENESDDGESTDDGDSIPGFGVAPAIAALLTVGFLARKR